MGIKDSAKNLAARLRLDSHHAIERFGVLFAVLAVLGTLSLSGASVSALSNQRATLSSTVLYTPSFTTSKTQLPGEVTGVYTNTEGTRAMVLMQFDDPSSVSANAANYQAFLTGSGADLAPQTIDNTVAGEVVVFGSTGYMAVVLDAPKPFDQQILNLTVRANAELVYRPGESRKIREDLKGQDSFAEFDQWRVFFNPGASEVTTSPILDTVTFDPGAVYADLVVAPQEETLEKAMDDQLGQMMADQARITEYESEIGRVNVDGIFLTLPVVPEPIDGDEITGEPATGEEPSTLALDTDWVSPSGFDLDWRAGSVAEGYLDEVVPDDESYVTFLAEKAALTRDGESDTVRVADQEWPLSNGAILGKDPGYDAGNKAMKPLFDLKNGLSQAYQDYYAHKLDYQVDTQVELIELEIDLLNVRSSSSVNDGEKSLFVY